MKREELFFNLPKSLIAQEPVEPRDSCNLMVLERKTGQIKHDRFNNLCNHLKPGDVLVFNDSKVLPARLIGEGGGSSKIEILLLKKIDKSKWEVMIGGRVKIGETVSFRKELECEVKQKLGSTFVVEFNQSGDEFLKTVFQIGLTPTPPYIKKLVDNPEQYQTIYARELGSAAAPTAGLHFTQQLLSRLRSKGVQTKFVTLHVGLGTFQPIKTETIEEHNIHTEWYSVEQDVYDGIRAKVEGKEQGRVIAVGTTSVRVLETIFSSNEPMLTGETSIYIYPGYEFKAVDAMITNFHTPYSSLLALVYALAGQNNIKKAYQEAIDRQYRFFSFGDAMLIE